MCIKFNGMGYGGDGHIEKMFTTIKLFKFFNLIKSQPAKVEE